MSIVQVSSSARDRKFSGWSERTRTGQTDLPRIQRDRGGVIGFLNKIVRNSPVGLTLLLAAGPNEVVPACKVVLAAAEAAFDSESASKAPVADS